MRNLVIIFLALLAVGCGRQEIKKNLDETVWVRNQGADMPVYVHGNVDSKVIMLVVHGGPGGNGPEYRSGSYAEDLESKYAVAYWDQRGQGMSQGKFSDDDITIETMVEDLRAVILVLKDKYEGSKVFVYGHSWGGTLTAKYMVTEDYQTLAAGWIESNGAHDIPKLNKDAIAMFKMVSTAQIAAGNNVSNWQETLDWANGIDVDNITDDIGGEINSRGQKTDEWLEEDGVVNAGDQGGIQASSLRGHTNPVSSSLSGNYTSGQLVTSGIEKVALTSELNKVTIPSLFLWGRYDFIVPPSLGEDAFREVSSADKELFIFEKSGHSPMNNEWEAYNAAIVQFIERNR